MNLQQLRYVCEIAERGFSVSRAAAALHTSQPSMSRQIQALERELGVPIFVRSKRRLLALTGPGMEVCDAARKVVRTLDGLRQIGKGFSTAGGGTLVVTTSHTHARYVLPKVIRAFTAMHPKVRVMLRQGSPVQVAQWVSSGEADFSICSKPAREMPDLVLLPCYDHHKVVLVPERHPLLKTRKLTIPALAPYPLITYDTDFPTHSQVMRAFDRAGHEPNVILSATDVDVMKAYVKGGLGVAIVAALAYEKREDRGLRAIEAGHLFEPNKIYIGIQKQAYLRQYAFDFMQLFTPAMTKEKVLQALAA